MYTIFFQDKASLDGIYKTYRTYYRTTHKYITNAHSADQFPHEVSITSKYSLLSIIIFNVNRDENLFRLFINKMIISFVGKIIKDI